MKALQALSRDKQDTLLLVGAALLVIAPHFAHLPWWIGGTVCATLLWRVLLTLRGRRLPPVWLLLPIALVAMGGVFQSYGTLLGRDPGVAMLALLLAFKLLEMHAKRDLYTVLFLSFFLMLTNFFYSQTMLTGLAMAATIVVLLTVQVTFQYTGNVPPLGRRLRLAGRMFLLAAPLAAALFVLFPRFEGPLWGSPGDGGGTRSGLSDTMAPGTMTNLALSEDVAFRVRFDGAPPAQDRLYWRGVVLSHYDGRTWTRIGGRLYRRDGDAMTLRVGGRPAPYEVTLEPSERRWLFTLELTPPALDVPGERVGVSDELESFTVRPIHQRVRYRAAAYPDYSVQPSLDPALTGKWLQLPPGFNPKTRALARTLREGRADDARIVAGTLLLLRTKGFAYTLQPPLLGRDAVDDFLFATRQGFCEHYAGAFVFLMRAAGIPARVVTGYQGGELNPVDGYMTVRQSDAHAWAEVWLKERGWLRVDPTAAVAPDRVRLGLGGALPRQAPFGIAALGNDKDSWLARLRFHASAANNAWNQWILDYNPERQRNFLTELSARAVDWHTLAAVPALLALGWSWRLLRARRRRNPVQTAWERFGVLLARHGVVRAPDEGPHTLARRVAALALPDERKAAMAEFLQLYAALRYRALDDDERTRSVRRLGKLLSLSR
jgi:transglutaminase-like putative cysteine protease